MPKRSKILQLPEEIKATLDKRLISGGFSGYRELASWLAEQGFEISHSAIHRYGQEFEEKIAAIRIATEQAKAITDAVGDDAGATGDALIRLVQEKAFQVLVKMSDLDPEAVDFNKLTVSIAKLNNAAVTQKKWLADMKKKTEQAVENIEKKAECLDKKELLKMVKQEVYGIV